MKTTAQRRSLHLRLCFFHKATLRNRLQPRPSADAQPELPVVKAVFGSAKRLRATLLYSGGVEIDADASSRELPGGYRVAILTFDNVTLERNGKRYPLGFSNTPPVVPGNASYPTPSNTGAVPVLPGLFPGQH